MNTKSEIKKEWLTLFESSNQTESPNYSDTIKYFEKFADETPFTKMFTMGISPQGREIKYLVVSKEKKFTSEEAKKSGKAIILIQNGIHPGESEGKDASMILLREILITKEKENLLDNIILLIIPIFNVDGHERLSEFNRPNQNGPKKMGWRTNALNLNLNRDYMKADTPEMKAWLTFYNEWLPDFMIDNHTTNGADYQYHVTYGIEKNQNISSTLSKWVTEKYLPNLILRVEADGFLTAPYIEFKNNDIKSGIYELPAPPRLSHGYCAIQNRVCLLVETHSLKPYGNRVFSTLSMMTHTLNFINQDPKELMELNKKADDETINNYFNNKKAFPINFKADEKPGKFMFKGFKSYDEKSEITGSTIKKYSSEPIEFQIPIYNKAFVKEFIEVPKAYLIPKEFSSIIEIIKMHGVKVDLVTSSQKTFVEKYKFKNEKFWPRPYEGRMLVDCETESFKEEIQIEKGSFIIYTNQRTLRIIMNLLEPAAPDSFVSWGFFNSFFERKEYAEAYVMEPIAKEMLKKDESLKKEFFSLIEEDEDFRESPAERLEYFYKRSPYFDKGEKVYPVMRVFELIK